MVGYIYSCQDIKLWVCFVLEDEVTRLVETTNFSLHDVMNSLLPGGTTLSVAIRWEIDKSVIRNNGYSSSYYELATRLASSS